MTQGIVSGLKDRSRYSLNRAVFTEKSAGKKSLFEHRLFEEGKQLAKAQTNAELPADVRPLEIPSFIGRKTIEIYQCTLEELCQPGERASEYEETAKLDAGNILLYKQRITWIGICVAEAKIQQTPAILSLESYDEIRERMVVPEIEKKVIGAALAIAVQYGLDRLEPVERFFSDIMRLTVCVEILYVGHRKASAKP